MNQQLAIHAVNGTLSSLAMDKSIFSDTVQMAIVLAINDNYKVLKELLGLEPMHVKNFCRME